MFYEVFGYFLALMGAIGLCIIVAGAFIKIEKLNEVTGLLLSMAIAGIMFPFIPKNESLDLLTMAIAYAVLVLIVNSSVMVIRSMATMDKK